MKPCLPPEHNPGFNQLQDSGSKRIHPLLVAYRQQLLGAVGLPVSALANNDSSAKPTNFKEHREELRTMRHKMLAEAKAEDAALEKMVAELNKAATHGKPPRGNGASPRFRAPHPIALQAGRVEVLKGFGQGLWWASDPSINEWLTTIRLIRRIMMNASQTIRRQSTGAEVVNIALGIWVALSPFVLGFSQNIAKWSNLTVGIALVLVALAAGWGHEALEALVVPLGAWLFLSPFVLGFSTRAFVANNVIMAFVVIAAGAISEGLRLPEESRRVDSTS